MTRRDPYLAGVVFGPPIVHPVPSRRFHLTATAALTLLALAELLAVASWATGSYPAALAAVALVIPVYLAQPKDPHR